MSIKKSRAASFVAVALVYILATVSGAAIFGFLGGAFWIRLLLADMGATIVVFIFSVIFKNASVYDPYWSVQPAVILLFMAGGVEMTSPRALVLIAVIFWSVRLTANWAYTFRGLEFQDWRYTMLREQTGALFPLVNFFGIHMMPTLVVYACIFPAVLIFRYNASLTVAGALFFTIAMSAAVMQGISDVQMHRFQKRGGGGFIHTGLWKYSRHPNYLGEILMWWAIGLLAATVLPGHWYFLIGALLNTCLFLLASIPMADRHQSRKEGFGDYCHQTRMLLPLPKRGREPEREDTVH